MSSDLKMLADAVKDVEEQRNADFIDAEATGERPDLNDYTVEIPLETAKAFLAEFGQQVIAEHERTLVLGDVDETAVAGVLGLIKALSPTDVDDDDAAIAAIMNAPGEEEASVRAFSFAKARVAEANELRAEIARLTAENAAVASAIGSNRFMDLPDGGDVTLAEQVTRMRLALERAEADPEHQKSLDQQAEAMFGA